MATQRSALEGYAPARLATQSAAYETVPANPRPNVVQPGLARADGLSAT